LTIELTLPLHTYNKTLFFSLVFSNQTLFFYVNQGVFSFICGLLNK